MAEQKSHIVVVDDSQLIIEYLDNKLTELGYTVDVFDKAQFALKHLEEIQPDLILSDVMMPDMDGYEFCMKIKENPNLQSIPLLFISGESNKNNIVTGFEHGAVDYVTKPIIFEVLKARIETHIRLYHLQKAQIDRTRTLEALVSEKIDKLYKSQLSTITALAKLAEFRDEDTGTHLDRVEKYCKIIALELSHLPKYREVITSWFVQLIQYASPLHDIGKVAIPDNILLKPGKLTEEEFETMKTHAELGGHTLAEVLKSDPENEFIKMGYDIAYYHHEKWNGFGYPKGLSGDEIPLCARIMAVADVYDALRSERCYKKGFSHEKSVEIIKEGSGNHFDPEIVEAFCKNVDTFDEVWTQFNED